LTIDLIIESPYIVVKNNSELALTVRTRFIAPAFELTSSVYTYSIRTPRRPWCGRPVLYEGTTTTLYSNRFRGEPAIPGPESFFSANLSSSQNTATFTSSGLRVVLTCSPWPKLDRPASGLIKVTFSADLRLALAKAPSSAD